MVRLLVDLQISSVPDVPALFDIGLPDLRGPALIGPIRDVLGRRAGELTGSERRILDDLIADLPTRFAALAECGLPDTLVHGDFHLGNIKGNRDGRADGFTILDWGDSGVGNPMLDQLAFARFLPADLRPAVDAEWSQLWRAAVPRSDPEGAVRLLRPVTALREAAVYQRFLDNIEPDEHRYHDGDPAQQLRHAAIIATGGA
jgi:aminoglycoside phosphotransferase (APT) family kinase protein